MKLQWIRQHRRRPIEITMENHDPEDLKIFLNRQLGGIIKVIPVQPRGRQVMAFGVRGISPNVQASGIAGSPVRGDAFIMNKDDWV